MGARQRDIRRAAARLASLGKVVVTTESQDERLRASLQSLRTEDTYSAAATCAACREVQTSSGDASALCAEHLAKAMGL